MAGNGPTGRLKYRSKDGVTYDVGAFWSNARGMSLGPQKTNEDHERFPKMRLSEAARRVEQGDGWLNVYMEDAKPRTAPQERREAPARRRQEAPDPDPFNGAEMSDFGDDDIPF